MNGISFNTQNQVVLMKIMLGDLLLYHPWSSIAKVRNNLISNSGIAEIFSSFPVDDTGTDLDQEDNAGKPLADEDETFSWLDFHPRGFITL